MCPALAVPHSCSGLKGGASMDGTLCWRDVDVGSDDDREWAQAPAGLADALLELDADGSSKYETWTRASPDDACWLP
jgi:hypothetical protein